MYFIYILTNEENNLFYTGVTNNILRRTLEHIEKLDHNGFPERYNLNKLVYYEQFEQITDAIAAEKRVKKMSQNKKRKLISEKNPKFEDLLIK